MYLSQLMIILKNLIYKFRKYFSKFIKFKKKNRSFKQQHENLLQDIIEGHIIYGTGNAGKQVYEAFLRQNQKVYCFVDDDLQSITSIYMEKIISKRIGTFIKD